MPLETANKLAGQMRQRIVQPETAGHITNDWAFVPGGSGPDGFAQSLKAEYAEWARVVNKFGIKLE